MRYTIKDTPCGQIRGADTCQGYYHFQNIPYATAQRWEIPQEVTQWEGIYDATYPTPHCLQETAFRPTRSLARQFYNYESVVKQTFSFTEDCQRLNIWAPVDAENMPVLVYIHGGGYSAGGSAIASFSGHNYAKKGLVTVTINYRLNVFASAVGDGHTGNYGLWDQIYALRWLQHNIASFGGDPNRITVMGESAGAMSVQNLIYSPLAKGLFHGAIMMSGGGILPKSFSIRTPDTAKKLWTEIGQALYMDWEQLKQVDPKELFLTWEQVSAAGKYVTPSTPVIDGITIPDDPMELAKSGQVNDVPALIGFLSEDMWPHTLYSVALEWGLFMEQAGHAHVYGYYFDRQLPGSDHGAYHSCDVRYAFGTLEQCWRPFTETDYRISENMMDYFAAFAKTGKPCVEGLAKWEPLGKDQTRFLHFGNESCAMVDVPEDRLQAQQAKGKPFPTL